MAYFDIFNGDADGIFSLVQLRKVYPLESTKITGVKRDIALVQQCQAIKGDNVTILDVSMEKNIDPLNSMLKNEVDVFYADHHRSGVIPNVQNLEAHIHLSSEMCTCLIINDYLDNAEILWAIAGAYGDNLIQAADHLCKDLNLSQEDRDFLCELGTLINYNGYGSTISDLHYHPAELYELLMQYDSPFALRDDKNSVFYTLRDQYQKDMDFVGSISPYFSDEIMNVIVLPDASPSRRASGVLGNKLANDFKNQAQLILTPNPSNKLENPTFTVSLRAPLSNKMGADEICSRFATGGGRAAAAGINQLPFSEINKLIAEVEHYYYK